MSVRLDSSPASCFGNIADDYELGRPSYPREIVGWALGHERIQVLDVGAGTGKLTQVVHEAGHYVTAAEPLPKMRAVLSRRLAGIPAIAATAERLPMDAASFDAVVVGQAFHWFEYHPALSEMARVVRPRGVLALFWNVYAGDQDWLPYPRSVQQDAIDALYWHSSWSAPVHRAYAWNFEITATSVLAFCRSHSSVAVLPKRQRKSYSTQVAAKAAAVAEEGTLPLVTHVWRCERQPVL